MEFKNKDLVVCDGKRFCDDEFCPWKHPRFAGHSDSANDEWGLCRKIILKYSVVLRIVKLDHKSLDYSELEFLEHKKTKHDAYSEFPRRRSRATEEMNFNFTIDPVSDTSSDTVIGTSPSIEGEEYEITWG